MSLDGNTQRDQGPFSDLTVLSVTVVTRAETLLLSRKGACAQVPQGSWDLRHPRGSMEGAELPRTARPEGGGVWLPDPPDPPAGDTITAQVAQEQKSPVGTAATCLTPEAGGELAHCANTKDPTVSPSPAQPSQVPWELLLPLLSTEETRAGTHGPAEEL